MRWRPIATCLAAALIIVGFAIAIPLFDKTLATADVDATAKASEESAQLQQDGAKAVRRVSIDVPAILQYPELPTGCESIALTDALSARGFELTKTEIADYWLPTSDSDFVNAFWGNPYSTEGNACMAPGVTQAAANYLAEQDTDLEAVDMTGAPFEAVLDEVAAGNPTIVWCTIGLEEPGECYRFEHEYGRTYRLITNSHCVVVSGFDLDNGVVFASDPLAGQVAYPLETLIARYYATGAQAVVIR